MALRIVHTADWQIGMRAVQAGADAPRVREARFETAARIVELAGRVSADLLLLAGDTFEDNAVDPVVVRRVVEILARSPCPVYVLPGNHDPLGPTSVFRHPAWREPKHLHVFESAATVELDKVLLLPCPCASRTSTEDPTRRIPRRGRSDGGKIRIGVAHGSVQGHNADGRGDDFPIAADAAERADVDYLALGHWHSTLVLPSEKAARMAYPGTPEPTRFGERSSGSVLLVSIDGPGAPVRVTVEPVQTLRWMDRDETLLSDEEVARLRREIEELPAPDKVLLRLRLSGLLSREGFDILDELEELTRARFLHARLDRDGLAPRPADAASWIAALPDGVARTVAERLLEEARSEDDGRRDVAVHALGKLVAMARRPQP